ncbi:pitrilysin family protein [Agarivorans sp. 1_MG-2023]|uniref:M16 family metallopeptidase n=1 Tax=Agarivorans sp. 1_MG-2023 TaxID=3062634 RepID=UPI0026E3BC69|nr:pitrilysin family protein [Agarivorans sp. 1_MG-2023]MDO6765776.1 pitrilysin family protein [Agarivorans sp. 1_MG-2023]
MLRWLSVFSILWLAACTQIDPKPGDTLPKGIQLIEASQANNSDIKIAYKKYRLENGLTVLLYQDDNAPLAHVDVTYHVGSNREEPGKSGFAHFFEHMMFQGSKHVGDQEHFRIINEAGGTMNGSTTKDRTNYYQTVPANQLEKVLWLEADRMGFLLEAVSQKKFEIQRDTVKNERAQRVDNAPYGLLSERVDEALYPREHPYSWQPIGYIEDLNRVDVNDLKAFFLRWYGPNNAVISIGGDIDEQQTLAWVAQYFGSIPSGPEVPEITPLPAQLSKTRYISLEDRVHIPLLYISYPTVYAGADDEVALDMFSEILGGGKNSLLHQSLVESGKALSAGSSHYCREMACTLSIYVRANPQAGLTLAQLQQDVDQAINDFAERGVNAEDLQRVRSSLKASTIYSLESVSDVVTQLAFGEIFFGQPLYISQVLEQFKNVDDKQVQQAYQQYIINKPRVVMSVVPKGQTQLIAGPDNYQPEPRQLPKHQHLDDNQLALREVTDNFDRSVEPASGPAVAVKLPDLWQAKLSNGLQVLGTSEQATPTVTLQFRLAGGSVSEPAGKEGLAKLTAQMLMQSTQQTLAADLADELVELGASVSFSGGLYSQNINLTSLTETLPQALNVLEQRLLTPAFDPQEFEREKARHLQSIEQKFNQPSWLASIASQGLFFGEGSRLATSSYGSRESIASLSLEDVKQFWQQHYQPDGSQLVAVSNLSQQQLETALTPLQQQWQGKASQAAHLVAKKSASNNTIYLLDKPGAVQSVIRIGRSAMPYDATGEYFKANLMNFNFGGNFNSRINMNLREDKGYTYGVSSGFGGFKDGGSFVISTDVRQDATAPAIKELLTELDAYSKHGPSEQELAYMRSAVSQQEALAYATPSQKASFLMQMLAFDLTPEFVATQNQITATISQSELQQLAAKYFSPEQMIVVVVGDKEQLLPELKKIGMPVQELAL